MIGGTLQVADAYFGHLSHNSGPLNTQNNIVHLLESHSAGRAHRNTKAAGARTSLVYGKMSGLLGHISRQMDDMQAMSSKTSLRNMRRNFRKTLRYSVLKGLQCFFSLEDLGAVELSTASGEFRA